MASAVDNDIRSGLKGTLRSSSSGFRSPLFTEDEQGPRKVGVPNQRARQPQDFLISSKALTPCQMPQITPEMGPLPVAST